MIRIKHSASQMRQDTLTTSVRLFLDVWNEEKIRDLHLHNAQAREASGQSL